jgi:tetratricopeptide (TPR) repeat protein
MLILKGSILIKMGDFERVIPLYETMLQQFPGRPMITLVYGHALRTVGEQEKAIAAYRQTIQLRAGFGDAWWSLANLKTFEFSDQDIETMRTEIAKPDCRREDNFHLCFALGKALEINRQYDESFHYYQLGNDTKARLEAHNPENNQKTVQRLKTVFSKEFVADHEGCGVSAADPIFIVGLPRCGSTLLEQILASHSLVDGTKELVYMPAMVRNLGGKIKKGSVSKYPEILVELGANDFLEMGQEYLGRSREQRGKAPFFIDKMPNNFMHISLIHLTLPNAKIIDARRHPMAACFSGFTQLFARGQAFTYGLKNIGWYYRDYVELMDHWERVLPGKVLRVHYEDVVADTEKQVRRILDHCELEFEQNCLQFHKTERAVRTASSEQVRQPIYKAALDHWRNYEPHLDELKSALGPVLDHYPID